ncbi:restriction endonuclease [Lysinibacillus boronitolerans]|uniref:Restriction endonuclease n=1 Tax=Lysinibacillus boronitolerans JCM 21713 = 10a = NBRC 103108 TaxID=1294264 RepID=A0ABR4XX41_9BACI|nr:restriction endonuclease [Lysinibacillus boronitolerans]KGR83642.1 restriction endonuclease [Lysinibacillus boronitolerans JCM 21713 = 10a = NBRC 103108]
MEHWWMVRAGDHNELIETWLNNNIASVGWPAIGNPKEYATKKDLISVANQVYEERKPSTRQSQMSQVWRFINEIKIGDRILSYSKEKREYIIGTVEQEHFHNTAIGNPDYPNHIKVKWEDKRISRDSLSQAAKNTLGSILTIFRVDNLKNEIEKLISNYPLSVEPDTEAEDEAVIEDLIGKSTTLIADKIDALDAWQLQDLVGGLLQAMDYNVKVSPKGPDGGVDVLAYKDAFGFEKPIIKVQVKHRKSSAGSPEIQQLLGADPIQGNSLFVSTGGFTNQALAVAKHSAVKTLDLDDLVELVVEWYEKMPNEVRALIPLKRIYIPE